MNVYILNEANWDKLGDGPLCENINSVDVLDEPNTLKDVFDIVVKNGWTVAETSQGPMY